MQLSFNEMNFDQAPMLVIWEATQACDLACVHCRASAQSERSPNELTTEQGYRLLDEIRSFGEPLMVFTGGDPLKRPDLYDLIRYAVKIGLRTNVTPSATPLLTAEAIDQCKAAGITRMAISLDGHDAASHDDFRGVPGTFDLTLRAMRWAQEIGMPLQVNTLACEETAADAPGIFELLKPLGVARWSLFFLISVGRGKVLQPLSPEAGERLMNWVYDITPTAPFIVATTEAPSYRRVALQRMREEGLHGDDIKRSGVYRGFGIRDGHGIVFVSHTGDICPAGFLPLTAGNVRTDRLADVYRSATLFRALHDPAQLEGRCGECEYHALCGGSRARAYGASGNPLAEDPLCVYQPRSAVAIGAPSGR